MPMDDLALMELQVDTLYVHDEDGRLIATRESDPARAPRFFLGRTKAGNLWRFGADLPSALARQLDALAASEPVPSDLRQEPILLPRCRQVLGEHEEVRQSWIGPAYQFPDELPRPENTVAITRRNAGLLGEGFAWLREELGTCSPIMAALAHGEAVSVCHSARLSSRAAEAGVETLAAFRGHGHASRAVAAWAIAIREMGRVPLYSTSWDNAASQGVARRLALRLYGVDFSIT